MSITGTDEQTVRCFCAVLAARGIWPPCCPVSLPMRYGTCRARAQSPATTRARDPRWCPGDAWAPVRSCVPRRVTDNTVGQDFAAAVQCAAAAYQRRYLDVSGWRLMRLKDGCITEIR